MVLEFKFDDWAPLSSSPWIRWKRIGCFGRRPPGNGNYFISYAATEDRALKIDLSFRRKAFLKSRRHSPVPSSCLRPDEPKSNTFAKKSLFLEPASWGTWQRTEERRPHGGSKACARYTQPSKQTWKLSQTQQEMNIIHGEKTSSPFLTGLSEKVFLLNARHNFMQKR